MNSDPYGTHQEALAWAAAQAGEGAVLEVGVGWWSTPLLHGFCEATGRQLLSLETFGDWLAQMANLFKTDWHGFGDNQLDFSDRHWALALIDGAASDRARYIKALLGNCQYLVCHDTEPDSRPNYPGTEEALAAWPNRRDFARLTPHTTVVWA